MSDNERALKPEDLTRLFVERSNAGDAEGVAELYEEQAVMAYPPGSQTVGRDAIRGLWEKVLANAPHFEQEPPLPTLTSGDIALTSTPPQRWRGRPRAGGSQATGRHLASSARPARVRATGPVTRTQLATRSRTRTDPQLSTGRNGDLGPSRRVRATPYGDGGPQVFVNRGTNRYGHLLRVAKR